MPLQKMRFLERLSNFIDKCIEMKLGDWISDGNVFYVPNLKQFKTLIKPYSFNTFKRHMVYYDFDVYYSIGMTFYHPKFTRDLKIKIPRGSYKKTTNQEKMIRKRLRDKEYRESKKKEVYIPHISIIPAPHISYIEHLENIDKQVNQKLPELPNIDFPDIDNFSDSDCTGLQLDNFYIDENDFYVPVNYCTSPYMN